MKFILQLYIVFVFIISFTTFSYAMPSSYLPVTHRAYEFIELMETKKLLTGAYLGTKPAIRTEIARILFGLVNEKRFMTDTEKTEFEYLLREFTPDFTSFRGLSWDDYGPSRMMPGFLKGFLYRNRRNMYSSHGKNYSLYFDPVIVRKGKIGTLHESSKDDNVYTASNGFIVRGTVGKHFGFHIDIQDAKEWGSRNYPTKYVTTMPGLGYATFKGDHAEFDETFAHIAYSNGPFVISYGRDRNIWSRGKRGTLIMSEYGAPFDMLRLETGFWRLKFIYFAAEIEQFPAVAKFYYNNPPDVPTDFVAVKKYLSGHRVEINFTNYLNVGFHETVVYGGRWDSSYLNPVMFFKGAEHSNGDHDNVLLGMDFRLLVHRCHSIYGELLIDDITTTKLGTDWFGNKLAYTVGSFLLEPFGLKDFDSRIEYTRINPLVYTHKYPINSYTHYGDVLGHQTGPNSDELLFEIRKRFTRRFHTSLSLVKRRHGANTDEENVGGDPLEGFKMVHPTKTRFLAGELGKTTSVGFDLSYEIYWELFIKMGYTYEDSNGDGINCLRFSLGLNE